MTSAALHRRLAQLGAPTRRVMATDVGLQLCEPRNRPFSAPGWVFELKYDGFRLLAQKDQGQGRILLRRGSDVSKQFPEIAGAVSELPAEHLVLDGELIIPDAEGRPVFERLSRRATLVRAADVHRAMRDHPAMLMVFDLLAFDGFDLRGLPLRIRKELLRDLLPSEGALRFVDHIELEGEALWAEVEKRRLEGIVAKRLDSPYRAGRHDDWLKIAMTHTADFAVVGYVEDFNALHLAVRQDGDFVYAGKVGSGFGPRQQARVRAVLESSRISKPPCVGEVPRDRDVVWVEPRLVAEVRYKNWPEGLLPRQPVLLRFRSDKSPQECFLVRPVSAPRKIKLTNLKKVFWPAEGLTKGDLITYYQEISNWMLPYLRGRPLTLTRYPDGIEGKHFFQKHAPAHVPEWFRRATIHSESEDKDVQTLVCDDQDSLIYLANMGTIPLHIGASRVPQYDRPDWCVLDLDPKEAPFDHVIRLAWALRRLCEKIELPAFVKTSGSSGLHVYVPLGGQVEHRGAVTLAEILSSVMLQRHADISTTERNIAKRRGRVYLDCYQNGQGKTVVAPFSVRPLPGAPVSMPLQWSEVGPELSPRQFTMRDARERMEKLGKDPMLPLLSVSINLSAVLGRLQELVQP